MLARVCGYKSSLQYSWCSRSPNIDVYEIVACVFQTGSPLQHHHLMFLGSNSIAHFAGGVYDVGFNSPPDFTGPMSNRSDMSENDKRLAVLQRQQSGIASSPQGEPDF